MSLPSMLRLNRRTLLRQLSAEVFRADWHPAIAANPSLAFFPLYRHTWQTLGSAPRIFAWCNISVRGESYPLGSDPYVNLALFVAWRGRGLPVEAPAVRR